MVTLMTPQLKERAPDDESQSQSQDVNMAEVAEDDDESQRRNRLACFQLFTKFTKEVSSSSLTARMRIATYRS